MGVQESCCTSNKEVAIKIMAEFSLGKDPLPKRICNLFTGKIRTLLEKNCHTKIKWLISIYSAGDQFKSRHTSVRKSSHI